MVSYLAILVSECLQKWTLIIVLVLVEEVFINDLPLFPNRNPRGDVLAHGVALRNCAQTNKTVRKPE